jgi:hypothetical protein
MGGRPRSDLEAAEQDRKRRDSGGEEDAVEARRIKLWVCEDRECGNFAEQEPGETCEWCAKGTIIEVEFAEAGLLPPGQRTGEEQRNVGTVGDEAVGADVDRPGVDRVEPSGLLALDPQVAAAIEAGSPMYYESSGPLVPPGQRERGEDDAYEAPSGRSGGCAPSTDVDGFLCGGLFHCDRPEYHAGPHASAVPVGEGADSGPDHQAYADPIDGGWGGYEAACHDCAWRGGVVHDDKGLAQEEAWEHAEQAPPPSPSGAGQPQLHPEAGQRARRILELDASDRDHADAAREIYVEAVYLAQYVLRALSAPRETRGGRQHD